MSLQDFGQSKQELAEAARVSGALLDALREGGVCFDDEASIDDGGVAEFKRRMGPEGCEVVLRVVAVDLDEGYWPSGASKAVLSIYGADRGERFVEMYIVRRGAKHEGWPTWRVHYERPVGGYSGREPLEVGRPGQPTGWHAHIDERSALEFVRNLAAFFASL